MNGEVFEITKVQAIAFIPEGTVHFHECLDLSQHILAGIYNDQLLFMLGFIPLTFLSDKAYIWGHATEAAAEHPLMIGRHGRKVVARALEVYSMLYGDCFEQSSARWLRSLGAKFVTPTTFRIIR